MLLHEKLKNKRIILGSRSPRRRELLGDCDIRFEVADSYEVEEIFPADMPAAEVAEYLSRLKADGYPLPLAENDILITADTVVINNGEILGKPTDRDHAIRMIASLGGKTHTVVTGVTIRSSERSVSFSSSSEVTFRELDTDEIEYYVDTYRPFDKAGAYGIQEWIGCTAIESISGSFYNVMGLPVAALYKQLKQFA